MTRDNRGCPLELPAGRSPISVICAERKSPAVASGALRDALAEGSRRSHLRQLPTGVTAGEVQWPIPEKVAANGFTNYVYHGQVLFLVPLTLANNLPAGRLELKAAVSWIECETSCVPGNGNIQATLTVGPESKPSSDAPLIAEGLLEISVIHPHLTLEGLRIVGNLN